MSYKPGIDVETVVADYVITTDGDKYVAYGCRPGLKDFVDTDASTVIQDAIDSMASRTGGVLWLKPPPGNYVITRTVRIPKGFKNLIIQGCMPFGKSYHFPSIEVKAPVFLQTEYEDDVRTQYGVTIRDLKFVGDPGYNPTILDLSNVDTFLVENCTFLKYNTAILVDYKGTNYPLPEQPGKGWVTKCEFAEALGGDTIVIRGSTQINITHNFFESFGNFNSAIRLQDTNKVRVIGNEFNPPTDMASLTAYILIENVGLPLYRNEYVIRDNWAYFPSEGTFIRLEGPDITNVTSKGNQIQLDYDPVTAPVTKHTYSPHNWIWADDYINVFANRVMSADPAQWANNTWQNNGTDMLIYVEYDTTSGASTSYVRVLTGQVDTSLTKVAEVVGTYTGTLTVFVQSGWYWRVETDNTAFITSLTFKWK